MSSLLPLKPTVSRDDRDAEPRLVALGDSAAEDVLSAVSSTTARRILDLVYEEPRPASALADELDTSLQNVSYHLDRLEEADVLNVAEVWYSGQGREMNVYAPTNSALVLYAGAEETTTSLTDALHRALGAAGVVGLASAAVHARWAETRSDGSAVRTLDAEQPAPEPDPTLWETLVAFATGPGGTVLALGLVAIVLAFAAWYWRSHRPARRSRSV